MKSTAAESIKDMIKIKYPDRTESKPDSMDEGFALAFLNHLNGQQEEPDDEPEVCLTAVNTCTEVAPSVTVEDSRDFLISGDYADFADGQSMQNSDIILSSQGADLSLHVAVSQAIDTGLTTANESIMKSSENIIVSNGNIVTADENADRLLNNSLPQDDVDPVFIGPKETFENRYEDPAIQQSVQKEFKLNENDRIQMPGDPSDELPDRRTSGYVKDSGDDAIMQTSDNQENIQSIRQSGQQSAKSIGGPDEILTSEISKIRTETAVTAAQIQTIGFPEQSLTDAYQAEWATNAQTDLSGSGISQNLVDVPQQTVAFISMMMREQHQEMRLRLYPDHLGEIQIQLTKDQNGMSAILIADREEACILLERNLTMLRNSLAEKQITCRTIEVRHTDAEQGLEMASHENSNKESYNQSADQAKTDHPGTAASNHGTGAQKTDPQEWEEMTQNQIRRFFRFGFDRTV